MPIGKYRLMVKHCILLEKHTKQTEDYIMDKWQISKTDQSFEFINRYDSTYGIGDFCSWYRKVMIISAMLLFLGVIGGLAGWFLLAPLWLGIFTLFGWPLGEFMIPVSAIELSIGTIVGILYTIRAGWRALTGWADNRPVNSTPGIVRTYYKSFKGKFCPLIEIID